MWKWIVAGIAGLVIAVGGVGFYLSDKIYIRWPHAEVTAADFSRKYSPGQLRADFAYLTRTVEHIHPDIAAITDASYPALKAATLAALNRSMTRMEFFRVLAPFAGRAYHDGHTEIISPSEEWDAYKAGGGRAPPFTIRFDGNRILIAKAIGAPLAQGAELVSLNGVNAPVLQDWLINTESAETKAAQEAFAARGLAARMWEYGLRPPFAIRTRQHGNESAINSPGVPVEQWVRAQSIGNSEPFHLDIDNGVAHLVVRGFDEPWDKYQGWLKATFQRIHDAHVRAVVLDLRGNSGGDTRQSDALQTYLSVKELPAMRLVTVKATPEVKAAYRTLLPEGFRWIPLNSTIPQLAGIQNAPDNGFFAFSPEGVTPTYRSHKNDLVFTGPLYLLISPLTYSTALIAAAPYKYWKRATVIGTPSSEGLTFYGDYYEFDLPNTKIQMHVSHKRFDLFGAKGPRVGLQPDIAIDPVQPDALAIAIKEIRRTSRPR
jgi:hypothetical protein